MPFKLLNNRELRRSVDRNALAFHGSIVCLFSGLTSVLAKCGIKKTDSDIATALRTIVVLLFFMGHGIHCRLGKYDNSDNAEVFDFFNSIRTCNWFILDVLF